MVDREAGEEMAGELCPGLAVQPGLVAIRETSCECRRERAGGESGRECGPARPPQEVVGQASGRGVLGEGPGVG